VGQVSDARWERDRQLPRRIDDTEQEIGDGLAAALARIPGFEDGGGIVEPGHDLCAAVFEDDDRARVDGGHGGNHAIVWA
jgi:hypothetical protein